MAYLFFYTSTVAALILFLIICTLRELRLENIIIGLTTVGYSLVHDVLLGDHFKLFYYIAPASSTLFMIISAGLLYPFLNMTYTMFLPGRFKHAMIYTACWILAMLMFEHASILTKTVVFTGWVPIPWSLVIYLFTYAWIYLFYRFLLKKGEQEPSRQNPDAGS